MRILREWLHRLFGTLRPARRDSDLEEELRLHVELAAENARRRGELPDTAERTARLRSGGATQAVEALRDQRSLPWLTDLMQDLRYGWRCLARTPGFTASVVISLALGIGANTAIFSLLNTLMLRPLPVRAPSELVELLTQYPGDPRLNGFAWESYDAFRGRRDVFSDLVGLVPARVNIGGDGFNTETVNGALVVGEFFPALGIQPAVGRLIDPNDDRPGAGDTAVAAVSWAFWNSRFNLDPAIVGTTIRVNGVPATIVGVAPRAFTGLQVGFRTDVWLPVAMGPKARPGLAVVGRLQPGVSIEQAQAALEPIARRNAEATAVASNDPLWRQATFHVASARAGLSMRRDPYSTPLFVLMAIVGLLLAIACTNIASLLLARGMARRHELALRMSLGAGRFRIVRQVMTEPLLLTTIGTLIGFVVAPIAANTLVQILTSGPVPSGFEIHVEPDVRVLVFAAGVALVAGLFFGLAPAWQTRSLAPASSLHGRGFVGESRSGRLFGKSLIVAQVIVSLVLLSGAGLFLRHLSNLRNNDLGFERNSVLLVTLDPSGSGYDRGQLAGVYKELLDRFESIPDVRSAAWSATTPIARGSAEQFVSVEGFHEAADVRRRVHLNWVGPRYFETFGTPHISGRDFRFDDEGGPGVAIINQAAAQYYFGDDNPIGRRITSIDGEQGSYEIVGVVADAKYQTLHEPAPRTIYLNAFQSRHVFSRFAIRTAGEPTAIASDVERIVRDHLKTVRVASVTTLADQMDASIVPERVMATVSAFLAALGVLLASVGLYGLLAYSVARRTNEIGVRMALGATQGDIVRMVVRSALTLTAAGLAVGAPMAHWAQRLAAARIEHLPVDNGITIAIAILTMVAVAFAAAVIPARRAAHVRPSDALRV